MRKQPIPDKVLRKNALLAALPQADRKRLGAVGELLDLEIRFVLYEPNEAIRHVYFPLTGVLSMVTPLENGAIVELATVGSEGMIGLPAFFGARSVPGRGIAQVPGRSLRITAAAFRQALSSMKPLEALLHRYAQALINQISQSVACLRQHDIEQRTARWLLMTHDRVDEDTFPLTQEFLSQMLSARRQTVNAAASALQARGLIKYTRGMITVLDRKRLELKSCECYRVVRDDYIRLVGRHGTRTRARDGRRDR